MNSVLAQSYTDYEHIIVDGASSDNTFDIIHELEPLYKGRLKWISEPDNGIYDAMNKGIAMATGDVVGILNSDDFYTSDSVLEEIAKEMSREDNDAVYGDIHFVKDHHLDSCTRYYSSRYFTWWMMAMGYQPAHPSFYIRRGLYEKYGDFDTEFKIASDFEHMLRLIYVHRIKAKYLPMDFVTMRTGGASTNGLKSHTRIIRDHFHAYSKHNITIGYVLDFVRYPLKLIELSISKLQLLLKK